MLVAATNTAEGLRGSRQYLNRGAIVVLFAILLTHGGITMAQQRPTNPLETAAESALSGDPTAIRVLTDTVISQLPCTFHPLLNMNDRLFQAELQYRQHSRAGISIGQLVLALNQLADDLHLPVYVRTNPGQVQTYRMMGGKVYPGFLGPPPHGLDEPSGLSLSPSAATFLVLHLLQLKLIDPAYQTDPDTWVREVAAKRAQMASRAPSRSIIFRVGSSPLVPSPQYQAIAGGLATNSGSTLGPVLFMLSTLGI